MPVEILTTCARDHASEWSDHHPEGVTEEDGLTVRRFKVRPRDPERYVRLHWRLQLGGRLTSFEEEDFVRESVNSNDLYAYLAAERDRYWYAFIPYCFGTTWEGALVAPDRSLLIPCLHDEPFAHLALDAPGPARGPGRVLPRPGRAGARGGGGRSRVRELPSWSARAWTPTSPATARGSGGSTASATPSCSTPAGRRARRTRRCWSSTTPGIASRTRSSPLKLVLIGAGGVRVPERLGRDVLDLGFVPAQDKLDAYAAALALCQPSLLESFSIVMMEAWLGRRPRPGPLPAAR